MLRSLVALVAVALAAALLGCGEKEESLNPEDATTAASDFAIAGPWTGQLTQAGLKPFQIAVRIQAPQATPVAETTVAYTGINCGGSWAFLGREGEAYRFQETIDRAAGGKCKGSGTVTVTPVAAGRLDYVFRGGGVESRGVLTPATEKQLKQIFLAAGVVEPRT